MSDLIALPTGCVPVVLLRVSPTPSPVAPTTLPAVRETPPRAAPTWKGCKSEKNVGGKEEVEGAKEEGMKHSSRHCQGCSRCAFVVVVERHGWISDLVTVLMVKNHYYYLLNISVAMNRPTNHLDLLIPAITCQQ